jgi:hypothetical protein
MNTRGGYENQSLMKLSKRAVRGVAALLLLLPLAAWAGGVVTDCTEAALRAAMAGGGTTTFACAGTIALACTITNTLDTVLDATSHQISISGGDTVCVFYVQTNVTFVLNGLTIAHGRSTNGAGVFNAGGTVNATNTTFEDNEVLGASSLGSPSTNGGSAVGGAVANCGVMNLANCSFTNNSAVGGAGGPDADPPYGYGFPGGTGSGGAVWNSGLLTGNGCTFAANSAAGGTGGDGRTGYINGTQLKADPGGPGGDGSGAALFNCGVARLVNCTLALNTGAGGAGGMGGPGSPGFPWPPAPPGPNGSPGLGIGAIYDASGQCYLTNCTVAFNSCTGASSSPGTSSCGGIRTSGAAMVNTLLAENMPGGNCLGTITDLGHNLSSDTTCAFTNAASMNNTYALLGPLTNNGGPTATIALLPGSRAIDAGDTAAAPPTDQRGVPRPFGKAADIGAYEYNGSANPGPSSVVTECTEAALRAAMSGGGTVTFACDGTITLASTIMITTNTVLDATHHQITISGNAVGVFSVTAGIAFSLANLTVNGGQATSGGGILNAGGLLTATNCMFSGNCAIPGAWAYGGAIVNGSSVAVAYLSACVFTGNYASGATGANGLGGGSGGGGALFSSGTLTADLCRFIANSASGAVGLSPSWDQYGWAGGTGGDGEGGAICNFGTMTILRSMFTNNLAWGGKGADGIPGYYGEPGISGGDGGAGGSGGAGNGGAIYNLGTLQVVNTTFAANSGAGANGGAGGAGGDGVASAGTSGGSGGSGGAGGTGTGAIFNSGSVQLVNCTFAFDSGSGGNGGAGGAGGSETVYGGNGGSGGSGGSGFGSISGLSSSCGLTNCTFGSDQGARGAGAAGGSAGTGSYRNGTPGASGSNGISGGIEAGGAAAVNTLLAGVGGNCCGQFADLGHNLSSDGTCAFTHVGSMNNTDPKLGPIANNGGPTPTMALLPGSPAIDAGDTSLAPATDQRGFPRPAGLAADIGAYEYGSVMPTIAISLPGAANLNIVGSGNAGQSCRLLSSPDLSSWIPLATNQIGSDGTILFYDNYAAGSACRFYRLVMP